MKHKELSHGEIAEVCRSLSLLLHAGVTLADGAYLLAEEGGAHGELLKKIGTGLDGGNPFSDVMEELGCFPPSVSGMVRIGERTGRLEEALAALADFYEERQRTTRLLQNAVAYPSLILLLMLAVVGVLLVKVLPVFDSVYASLGSRLTGVAAGLLHLGQGLEKALPVLFVLLILGVAAAVLFTRWGAFREKVTGWYQAKFGDRGTQRKFNNARFARGLAMGLSSGLTVEESVDLAAMLLQDIPGAAKRCALCAAKLEQGASLGDALGESELLPPHSCRMLSVGIRGGNGDQVMADIAGRQMAEAEEALVSSISRVEPAMVMGASVLVGLILLAVMLPLMNIMSAIG